MHSEHTLLIFLTAGATWLKLFSQGVVSQGGVFADAGLSVDPGIGSLIGNLGIMGVLVWHLWYHTTHSQPKMLDKFAAEQEKTRIAFATEQASSRAEHDRRMDQMQAMLMQALAATRTAVHDVKDTVNSVMLKAEIAKGDSGPIKAIKPGS